VNGILIQERLTMEKKLTAKLIGGPNDGQIWNLSKPLEEIKIAHRIMERDGKMRVTATVTYKLKSNGPPLEYHFEENPN
jgi:hypothetical protein